MKDHALDLFVFQQAFFFQKLNQMPGDGFAFAIRVSCEQEHVGFFQRLDDCVDVFFVALDLLVLHFEGRFSIDGTFFRYQVAHVSVGREYFVVLAEIFFNRFALGRGLDNYQVFTH